MKKTIMILAGAFGIAAMLAYAEDGADLGKIDISTKIYNKAEVDQRMESKVNQSDFNTATNNINTALRSDTLLTPIYTSYNLTIPNTLDDEDMAYSNEVSLVYDDNQGKYALALGGTRASNYLTSGDGGHTLLYNGGFARAEQLFDLTNGFVVAEQVVSGYVLGSQTNKPLQAAGQSLTKEEFVAWTNGTRVAIGRDSTASSNGGVALGRRAKAGNKAIAISSSDGGANTTASGTYSIAIGYHPSATAENAISIGRQARATAKDAAQIGYSATENSRQGTLRFRDYELLDENGRIPGERYGGISLSWQELIDARSAAKLVPGQEYRITNYVATTSGDMDSRSANHPFDIIVVADSITTLNEHARAVRSDGDTYFAGCNLAAWDVWYCIDNDTSRFAWAVADGGKGVIYRLVDEFQNDVPYDFKGIQFKAYGDTDNVWRYTFDSGDATDNTDYSLAGFSYIIFNNTIGQFYEGIVPVPMCLNRIVFKGMACYSNRFGLECYSNTFGSGCGSNTFGSGCYSNTFGSDCGSNTFGSGCYSNTFGSDCGSNTFGANCSYIKFGTASTVKSYCRYIRVASGNQYLYINPTGSTSSSAYYQNVEIVEGVNNTSTYKTIDDSNVNQSFKTTYQPAGSQVISIP